MSFAVLPRNVRGTFLRIFLRIFLRTLQALAILAALHAGQSFAQTAPYITSVSALERQPGELITITGEGFNSTNANNIVHIGGVKATILALSIGSGIGDDMITVIVPYGAQY